MAFEQFLSSFSYCEILKAQKQIDVDQCRPNRGLGAVGGPRSFLLRPPKEFLIKCLIIMNHHSVSESEPIQWCEDNLEGNYFCLSKRFFVFFLEKQHVESKRMTFFLSQIEFVIKILFTMKITLK